MGEANLRIELSEIEARAKEESTYNVLLSGLLSKAKELTELYEIEIVIVISSPSGKLTTLTYGDVQELLDRLTNQLATPEENSVGQSNDPLIPNLAVEDEGKGEETKMIGENCLSASDSPKPLKETDAQGSPTSSRTLLDTSRLLELWERPLTFQGSSSKHKGKGKWHSET